MPTHLFWYSIRVHLMRLLSGIGEALARIAAKKGARVVLVARGKEKLATIAAEINKETPGAFNSIVYPISLASSIF